MIQIMERWGSVIMGIRIHGVVPVLKIISGAFGWTASNNILYGRPGGLRYPERLCRW